MLKKNTIICKNCGKNEIFCKKICKACYEKINYLKKKEERKRKEKEDKNKIKDYIKFIKKNKHSLKKYAGGIKYRCYFCSKECLITTPFFPKKGNACKERINILDLELFKELIIKECKKKPTETSP